MVAPWETVGCDECRPALNYYLGMVWPEEATDDPSSRLVNEDALDDVKRETKASTSCGGCSDVVERILETVLGSSFESDTGEKSICACTKYTRDDVIKNIREKELRSVGAVMETLGWETVGCDECRPALNYYLGMVWPEEATDDPSSRLVNERFHANIQKDDTFSVVPRIYGGVATANDLRRIADVADSYDVPLIKITGGAEDRPPWRPKGEAPGRMEGPGHALGLCLRKGPSDGKDMRGFAFLQVRHARLARAGH